jgi:ABC-type multidrug transport system permease subunit
MSPPKTDLSNIHLPRPRPWTVLAALLQRSWKKAHRDVVVYGIRIAMYLGLAVLMGTVFLRMQTTQEHIQPFINAIFFAGAFMSFMAVAYVPAFLEDLSAFQIERANGLVGPFLFSLSNFLIGVPFLFIIAILFSVVQYWLSNFRPDGTAFMTYVLWLFLDLLAAESLVVFVSSIFPVFVVALTVTAFANGLWMAVNGFLVPMTILNVFWKYVFHYIDYQAYVFQGMMVNEFKDRTYDCSVGLGGEPQCMYASDLNTEGKIRGTDVLKSLGIHTGIEATQLGIVVGIIAGYRLFGYLALRFLRK